MKEATSHRRLLLILGLGAWFLLSAIVASQNYVEYQIAGSPVPFFLQGVWMLAVLAYWVAAAPLVLRIYRRFPFERGRVGSHLVTHLAIAAVLTFVHAPLVVWITARLEPFPIPDGLGFWKAFGFTLTASFHTDFLLYWSIVGGGLAFDAFQRARDRQLIAAQLEVELGEARLRALEAQIQPHFLFNALNTVSMMIRTGETRRAVEMVAQLGELLRESLRSTPQHEVPLSREIELAETYLHVERCRFDDRLEIGIDVPAALAEARVPHLVLQPLVENAVRHGVAHANGHGAVRISAAREDDRLVLEVVDNGPGDPPETSDGAGGVGGVGLENVRSRLEQLYGAAGSVVLERRPDEGTIARVTLPYQR